MTNPFENRQQTSPQHVAIPTYIVNLKTRKDRLAHIKAQFDGRPEFDTKIVTACEHENGKMGLWLSFRKVVQMAIENDDDVIIFVEDDHTFTDSYRWELLLATILEANKYNTDILLGGIGGGFGNVVPVGNTLMWIDHFWCTQFTVIYKRFYNKITKSTFTEKDTLDDFLSELTSNKLVIYPFVSIQKEFGYSDITEDNNIAGNITGYFKKSDKILKIYADASRKYHR